MVIIGIESAVKTRFKTLSLDDAKMGFGFRIEEEINIYQPSRSKLQLAD